MRTTQHHRADLAIRPVTGHQTHPRIVERRRLTALVELFTDAPRKPDAVYALQRREPRCKLPDQREYELVAQGIRDGMISRDRLVTYCLAKLTTLLALFPDHVDATDVLYVRLMAEQAEALEAQARAQGIPTPANREVAVRETREAIAISTLACAAYVRGALTLSETR